MQIFLMAVMLLAVAAAICFGLFAFTGRPRYRRLGVAVVKWTLIAAAVFFIVLALERIA